MECSSQVGVAPSSRTIGVIKILPNTSSSIPKAAAAKKDVDSTWLAFLGLP